MCPLFSIVDWITAVAIYIGARINFSLLMAFPFSLLIRWWLREYADFVQFGKECGNAIDRQRKYGRLADLGPASFYTLPGMPSPGHRRGAWPVHDGPFNYVCLV